MTAGCSTGLRLGVATSLHNLPTQLTPFENPICRSIKTGVQVALGGGGIGHLLTPGRVTETLPNETKPESVTFQLLTFSNAFAVSKLTVPNLYLAESQNPNFQFTSKQAISSNFSAFKEQGDTQNSPTAAFKNQDFQHLVRTPWEQPGKPPPRIPTSRQTGQDGQPACRAGCHPPTPSGCFPCGES